MIREGSHVCNQMRLTIIMSCQVLVTWRKKLHDHKYLRKKPITNEAAISKIDTCSKFSAENKIYPAHKKTRKFENANNCLHIWQDK